MSNVKDKHQVTSESIRSESEQQVQHLEQEHSRQLETLKVTHQVRFLFHLAFSGNETVTQGC